MFIYKMDMQYVGPIQKGSVVEIKQNKSGTYDGIIEENNGNPERIHKNKYHFFNNDNFLNIDVYYNFNVIASKKYEMEAANIVPC
jgi:hypothetical protein